MCKVRRKLLLSMIMLALTVITLSSTTYAWFVKNREAWTDEFDLDIDSSEGLLISADGINFSQDISLEDLTAAIERKTGVDYTDIEYQGITLKHTADKKISFDSSGNPEFQKDALTQTANPEYYTHTMTAASASEYIAFDLWVKVLSTGNQHPEFNLRLQENSYIRSEAVDIELQNSLTTPQKEYDSGDIITVNPADAMRLGVVVEEPAGERTMKVFEPNAGLGSAAIEGREDQIYNKNLNAMYTYYNKTHPFSKFTEAALDGEGFDTARSFDEVSLGRFTYAEEAGDYNTIKLTVCVWLEGWDADYFMGIPSGKVKVKLGFTIDNL